MISVLTSQLLELLSSHSAAATRGERSSTSGATTSSETRDDGELEPDVRLPADLRVPHSRRQPENRSTQTRRCVQGTHNPEVSGRVRFWKIKQLSKQFSLHRGKQKVAGQIPSIWCRVVQMEAIGFKMHLEAVGNGTVAILCGCCGSLLALYPKQGHGWRRSRCCHWQQVLQEFLRVWAECYRMTSLPDGLRINDRN